MACEVRSFALTDPWPQIYFRCRHFNGITTSVSAARLVPNDKGPAESRAFVQKQRFNLVPVLSVGEMASPRGFEPLLPP